MHQYSIAAAELFSQSPRLLSDDGAFNYLGIKIGCNPSYRSSWNQVTDIMRSKTQHWTNKLLSFAGKVMLIKSVLSSIPVYYFSMYKAPKVVIKEMNQICRDFLWCSPYTGKKSIAWVKWEDLCKSKEDGGLGLLNLEDFNLALLCKWGWRMLTEHDGDWRDIIQSKYLSQMDRHGGWVRSAGSGRQTKWWKDLQAVLNSSWFLPIINRVIGDGKHTRFWRDNWRGTGTLAAQYPDLYNISTDTNITLYTMWTHIASSSLQASIWRQPLHNSNLDKLYEMEVETLNLFTPASREDSWRWLGGTLGTYSSSTAYQIIKNEKHQPGHPVPELATIWGRISPKKVTHFCWKALRKRIATAENLTKRGVSLTIEESHCKLCLQEHESVDHLFCTCPIAYAMWSLIYEWTGVITVGPNSVSEHFLSHMALRPQTKGRDLWRSIWHATLWNIWKVRNKIAHKRRNSEHPTLY